jgi:hypothetical protein
MARSSCGLVVLYACSEHKRSPLVTQSQLQNLLLERRCNTIIAIQAGRWTRFLFLIDIFYRLIFPRDLPLRRFLYVDACDTLERMLR